MTTFLDGAPRFLLFTGKGGAGKTSLACAAAVRLADGGRRVLLVSTDPASNVAQVFGAVVGNSVTPVPGVPGLDALEIDPHSAAEQYRERIIGPVRGRLPEGEVAAITEQLSGSCTTEIASFNEFTDFLDPTAGPAAGYDHVVFDTAPTGHTLRLLQLPGDWTAFLDSGGEASCLGPMSGLDKHRRQYAHAVAALRDPDRTRVVLVARAERSSLAEAQRTAGELEQLGIRPAHLVVNAVLPPVAGDDDPLAAAVRTREQRALEAAREARSGWQVDVVPLRPTNMVGTGALRGLLAEEPPAGAGPDQPVPPLPVLATAAGPGEPSDLSDLVAELASTGHGLVMCMGKGGVGKTTVAAAVAVGLADAGHEVHLTTTDPAAHLATTVGDPASLGSLTVSRIDPEQALREYRARVLQTRGRGLDPDARAALEEDLLSPCNQEIAVFQEFSHLVNRARRSFVVMDTAPTGHTLLLMDTTGAYHRDIERTIAPGLAYTTPLMRLQDPGYTRILLVTLAETTPVLESLQLDEDLRRAGIRPYAWVVNQSLLAARPSSPLLRRRAALEPELIERVRSAAERMVVVPALPFDPVGPEALRRLASVAPVRGPQSSAAAATP